MIMDMFQYIRTIESTIRDNISRNTLISPFLVAFNDFYFKYSVANCNEIMMTHAGMLAFPNQNYSFPKVKKK